MKMIKFALYRRIAMLVSRIFGGIRFGVWIVRHNELMGENMFRAMSDLLSLLLKVATEDRHYMTEIMITIDADVPQPIVHIWAGAGASAEPHKRIKELLEENEALRMRIREK